GGGSRQSDRGVRRVTGRLGASRRRTALREMGRASRRERMEIPNVQEELARFSRRAGQWMALLPALDAVAAGHPSTRVRGEALVIAKHGGSGMALSGLLLRVDEGSTPESREEVRVKAIEAYDELQAAWERAVDALHSERWEERRGGKGWRSPTCRRSSPGSPAEPGNGWPFCLHWTLSQLGIRQPGCAVRLSSSRSTAARAWRCRGCSCV